MYELSLENFSGPIEKLLELIEEKKLKITELNLAEVTADFLNYLKQIEKVEPRLLADFVVVASRLLLIKSKALLPTLQITEEEEKDIKDLEARLRFYQQFKPAINLIKKMSEQSGISISRPLFFGRPAAFYPPKNLEIKDLHNAVKSIFETLEQFQKETKIVKLSLISLEEKIEEITKRIGENLKFHELTKEKPREEIIVLFLALLHLLAKQLIKVEQKEKFSDIIIEKFEI
jgi:segregation and condensation protein A